MMITNLVLFAFVAHFFGSQASILSPMCARRSAATRTRSGMTTASPYTALKEERIRLERVARFAIHLNGMYRCARWYKYRDRFLLDVV